MFNVLAVKMQLPHIDTKTTPNQIANWKSLKVVGKCYTRLFNPQSNNNNTTLMSNIIEKFWENEKQCNAITSMVIGVCMIILNPKIQKIEVTEDILILKILKNMISFYIFL